ncbi:hypothetical protein EB796_006329 [Bugula neritina]|uniref:Uncharacterized protein n=1 Tax=Bugula neritina TaxID=10212 RepID=A0A7J7KAY0_BUGNE|nr:hypothetical protein EB796_006329 [Bugula neritina]
MNNQAKMLKTRKSQLSLFSSKKVNQSKIIMKVLFLVAAIAVCLMTFTPATEAAYPRICYIQYNNTICVAYRDAANTNVSAVTVDTSFIAEESVSVTADTHSRDTTNN